MKQVTGIPNDSGETGESFDVPITLDDMVASMRIRKTKGKWADYPIKIVNAEEGMLCFDTSKIYPNGFTHYEILLNSSTMKQLI